MNNNHIPIFLAANNDYAPFIATTIASICYNTKSFIEFYILDSNISSFSKKLIESLKEKFSNFSIEFIKIDFNKYFSNFRTDTQWSLDVYSRFLIPDLKPNLDKIIYLDVDVLVFNDITKLYNLDLSNYGLGAVQDLYACIDHRCDLYLTNPKQYFNSGVLLINCDYWRKNKILDKLFEIEKKYKNKLIFFDQDLLNICFNDNYKILDYEYNLQTEQIFRFDNLNKQEVLGIKKASENPCIRHFSSRKKPWICSSIRIDEKIFKIPHLNEFWFFAKMTPFYEGMLNNFIVNIAISDAKINNVAIEKNISNYIKRIKLFNIIPIIKLKKKNNKIKVYLFNFIPILIIKERVK